MTEHLNVGDRVVVKKDDPTAGQFGRPIHKGDQAVIWKIEDINGNSYNSSIQVGGLSVYVRVEWDHKPYPKDEWYSAGYFEKVSSTQLGYSSVTSKPAIDTLLTLPQALKQNTCPLCGYSGQPSFNGYWCSNRSCKNG